MITYRSDQELPTIRLAWYDGNTPAALLDLSAYTPTVKVATAQRGGTTLFTKTSGITVTATSPNYVIAWTAADIATLAAAIPSGATEMVAYVLAYVRNAGSLDDCFNPDGLIPIKIIAAPT